MTVTGRSRDTTRAIAASRARLGVESSNDWIDGYGPQFVDFPFTDDDATFQDHLDVVRETCPTLTVAPDVEKGRTLEEVIEKADRLLQYSLSVIVVPKSVHPSEVPDRFRVGVPLADYGSGAPWTMWDYNDCRGLHLLGGGPSRQLHVRQYAPAPIKSVDTATLGKCSRFGWWDGKSCDAPKGMDYRERLEASLNHYWEAWN
jgi:hypothetical protein